MDSETIIQTLSTRLATQRYANNTIISYCGYAQIFLDYIMQYSNLSEIPISEIETFINKKVLTD